MSAGFYVTDYNAAKGKKGRRVLSAKRGHRWGQFAKSPWQEASDVVFAM